MMTFCCRVADAEEAAAAEEEEEGPQILMVLSSDAVAIMSCRTGFQSTQLTVRV